MSPSPIRAEKYRPTSPTAESMMASTAMITAVTVTTWASLGVMPWSMIRRKSRGWATLRSDAKTKVMRNIQT